LRPLPSRGGSGIVSPLFCGQDSRIPQAGHRMKKALFTLLLLAAVAARAEDVYKVEVIVFENLDPAAPQAELWPAQPGAPALDKAIELTALSAATAADKSSWRVLTPAQLTLPGAYQRLRSSSRYRPLLHVGWVPPLDNSARDAPLHVATAAGNAAAQISGTVALRRGRYLHADVDLVISKKSATARQTKTRRLRNNELHYLDHPLFGVLISGAPLPAPAAAAPPRPTSRVQ